jgi:phosphoribosylformylglycinamidine synthase
MKATVLVRPKDGILDPQGQAVEDSLRKLGFAVAETRVGRLIEFDLNTSDPQAARKELDEMCRRLLANPLIETYEIFLTSAEKPQPSAGPGARVGGETQEGS